MAQHTKIKYPTHNYHKSASITDPVEQEIKFNALGIKRILSQNAVRLKIGHLQVTAEFLISWSDYGDIWFTMNQFHDVDQVVKGLPFKQSFVLFDGDNHIIILYSKVLDSHRVIMSGTKEISGSLRASIYPHNGFFVLEEYCDFDDRVYAQIVTDGSILSIQAFLTDEFSEIYEGSLNKSRGFYIHDLTTNIIERFENENLSMSMSIGNYCVAPYVIIDGQEYRGDVVPYLSTI